MFCAFRPLCSNFQPYIFLGKDNLIWFYDCAIDILGNFFSVKGRYCTCWNRKVIETWSRNFNTGIFYVWTFLSTKNLLISFFPLNLFENKMNHMKVFSRIQIPLMLFSVFRISFIFWSSPISFPLPFCYPQFVCCYAIRIYWYIVVLVILRLILLNIFVFVLMNLMVFCVFC